MNVPVVERKYMYTYMYSGTSLIATLDQLKRVTMVALIHVQNRGIPNTCIHNVHCTYMYNIMVALAQLQG